MTINCALYLRISTDDGRQTVENQRAEVEQLVRARGFEPVLYEEMASAAMHRPVFERLMSDARAGRVHAVAAWSLDRISRGFSCFDSFRELARLGVRVLSVREPWVDADGPARELLVAVMSWVSGFERQRLIERTCAGVERARRQGKRIGRPPASPVLLHAAADMVRAGTAIRAAARAKGVNESTLRRHLARAA